MKLLARRKGSRKKLLVIFDMNLGIVKCELNVWQQQNCCLPEISHFLHSSLCVAATISWIEWRGSAPIIIPLTSFDSLLRRGENFKVSFVQLSSDKKIRFQHIFMHKSHTYLIIANGGLGNRNIEWQRDLLNKRSCFHWEKWKNVQGHTKIPSLKRNPPQPTRTDYNLKE